jgi:Histidine kinase-, DNA gyrase B-, and HSP90-like ATPase
MPDKFEADASPEKRLFISLLTRDISLEHAVLDLIDNSINAALEPFADRLKTADDYQRLLANGRVKPKVRIDVTVNATRIQVRDNADGISAEAAKTFVFRFGKDVPQADDSDRLSVYGIGLKRALFKCGEKFEIVSEHKSGGFELKDTVSRWAVDKATPWHFDITARKPTRDNLGTRITITDLHDDVVQRVQDQVFPSSLREKIAGAYGFFIGRVVDINLNGSPIEKGSFEIGANYKTQKFRRDDVYCNITAGIAAAHGTRFTQRNSGWFIFCNGRTVISADTTPLTGWGTGAGLPIFQPKFRPFLGTVFFASSDPEALPWTTTKASLNEENAIWQEAKRYMVVVGRTITKYLDSRYKEDSTSPTPGDLLEAAGDGVSALSAAVSAAQDFKPPRGRSPTTLKVQYVANVKDVKRIENYLRQPGMGGSEVGRYTFDHFLKNEVGVEK